jgi:hypothetical protein
MSRRNLTMIIVSAAEMRYDLGFKICERFAGFANKSCGVLNCRGTGTYTAYLKSLAECITPPAEQWPPRFSTTHTIWSTLHSLSKKQTLSMGRIDFTCMHPSRLQDTLDVGTVALAMEQSSLGLCFSCAREEIPQSACVHAMPARNIRHLDRD